MAISGSWNMWGEVMEACSCDTTCPCNFGSNPTRLPCDVVVGWHIQENVFQGDLHRAAPVDELQRIPLLRVFDLEPQRVGVAIPYKKNPMALFFHHFLCNQRRGRVANHHP